MFHIYAATDPVLMTKNEASANEEMFFVATGICFIPAMQYSLLLAVY